MSVPCPTVALCGRNGSASPGGRPPGAPRDRGDPSPRTPLPGPALSPSRAADFLTCPLLYRFRVIDRLYVVGSYRVLYEIGETAIWVHRVGRVL